MDEMDRLIIREMAEDLPLVSEPYRKVAQRIGIAPEQLLKRLRRLAADGCLRRMGVVLRHRRIGYTANALSLWVVPESHLDEIGAFMAAQPMVSHCYSRQTSPGWPYNLYAMLHASTRQECESMAANWARRFAISQYQTLYSTREWKKSSFAYFGEVEKDDSKF